MHNDSENQFKNLVDAAYENDLSTIREIVATGFDLSTPSKYGESVLSEVISQLSITGEMQPYRYDVIKLLLELGANPNQLDNEGMGSLTDAMLVMDTEMLRMLLDAGARPNDFAGFGGDETFYDYAEFDYRFRIWEINVFPEQPSKETLNDEDKWLNWMDGIAVKYQRRRPDHLFLLRQYGARCKWELNQNKENQ